MHQAHEYIFLTSRRYYYDQDAIAETVPGRAVHSEMAALISITKLRLSAGDESLNIRAAYQRFEGKSLIHAINVRSGKSRRTSRRHFATVSTMIGQCILAGCPKEAPCSTAGGAGTCGLVADRLQRNAILIELNPQYAVHQASGGSWKRRSAVCGFAAHRIVCVRASIAAIAERLGAVAAAFPLILTGGIRRLGRALHRGVLLKLRRTQMPAQRCPPNRRAREAIGHE